MTRQITDPGFGTTAGSSHARIVNREGMMNVKRSGGRLDIGDLYHEALITSWVRFMLFTVAVYTVANVLFAAVYLIIGIEHIHGTTTGSWIHNFGQAMFFSAQTLTTVGYGVLSPGSPWVSTIAAIEAMFGLLMFGVFTGLAFGRFSRIRPKFSFSENILLAPYREQQNALMIRLVNERDGAIMDARASMMLVVEYFEDDRLKRRFYDLTLEISHVRSLALSWTLVHPIADDSPLKTLSQQDLERVHAEVIVVIHAYDDTVGQPFYSRMSWRAEDLVVGAKFTPMFHDNEDGVVSIDLKKVGNWTPATLNDEVHVPSSAIRPS